MEQSPLPDPLQSQPFVDPASTAADPSQFTPPMDPLLPGQPDVADFHPGFDPTLLPHAIDPGLPPAALDASDTLPLPDPTQHIAAGNMAAGSLPADPASPVAPPGNPEFAWGSVLPEDWGTRHEGGTWDTDPVPPTYEVAPPAENGGLVLLPEGDDTPAGVLPVDPASLVAPPSNPEFAWGPILPEDRGTKHEGGTWDTDPLPFPPPQEPVPPSQNGDSPPPEDGATRIPATNGDNSMPETTRDTRVLHDEYNPPVVLLPPPPDDVLPLQNGDLLPPPGYSQPPFQYDEYIPYRPTEAIEPLRPLETDIDVVPLQNIDYRPNDGRQGRPFHAAPAARVWQTEVPPPPSHPPVSPNVSIYNKEAMQRAEASYNEGLAIGKEYGKFRFAFEKVLDLITKPVELGGQRSASSDFTDAQWQQFFDKWNQRYEKLPRLLLSPDPFLAASQRAGIEAGAREAYAETKSNDLLAQIGLEAVKALVISKAAMGPAPVAIGAARAGFNDCSALTAARIIRQTTGTQISAEDLISRWALPNVSFKFNVAKQYALDYFKRLGIVLAKPVELDNTRRLAEGSYAVFFRGGSVGGHVIYGSFSQQAGLQLIDEQTGQVFNSIYSAQNSLGMRFAGAYHVQDVLKGAVK